MTHTCGNSLSVGANCTIHAGFAPTTVGPTTAAIAATDNANGSPQTIALMGTGATDMYAALVQNWITEFNSSKGATPLTYQGPVTDAGGWVNYTVADENGVTDVVVRVPTPSSRLDAIFMGDSITYMVPFYQKLPKLASANVGVLGQTCSQMAARFGSDVVAFNPKAVVIACETNDSYLTTLSTSQQAISSMVLQARNAGIEIIVATAPAVTSAHPTLAHFIRQLNAHVRSPLCVGKMVPAG